MFGIELFSFPPRVMLEAAFFLAVSICEADVFLVDLYSEHHSLVSQLSAGSLSKCPPWVGSCLCLSVPAPPPQLSNQKLQGARVNPYPQGESQFSSLLPSPHSCPHWMSALCGCLLYHQFSDALSMIFKKLNQHV